MIKLYFILASFLFLSPAHAQIGSTADALGGAGIAAPQALDSALLNPAALAQLHEYNLGMQYFRRNYVDQDNLDQFGVTISDSGAEAIFPGALVYRQRRFAVGGTSIRENLFHLGVAVPLSKELSLGFSGYYLRTNLETGSDYNQKNMDASVYWKIMNELSVGVIAKTLFGSKDVAFKETQYVPGIGVGVQYSVMDILRLRGDVSQQYEANANDRRVHNLGVEFVMVNDFILRTGFKGDDYRGERFYTVGLGWEGPRLKAAYSYQDETGDGHGSAHTVDIWLNL